MHVFQVIYEVLVCKGTKRGHAGGHVGRRLCLCHLTLRYGPLQLEKRAIAATRKVRNYLFDKTATRKVYVSFLERKNVSVSVKRN